MKEYYKAADLAVALRKYMEKHKLTQEQIVEKLGIARSTINRYLSGKSKIRRSMLRILKTEGVV